MKCQFCAAEMLLRQEHCPRCGKKAVVDFDNLAESVHDDAAVRRGQTIEAYLKWVILAILMLGAVLYGINDLYDKPLVYDGSGLPALPISTAIEANIPSIQKPYVDPRLSPPLPVATVTAFTYRKNPIRDQLRSANKGDHVPEKSKGIQTAIEDGLKFLTKEQDGNGSWAPRVPGLEWDQWNTKQYFTWGAVGVTSLGLMAFLGEGEMPDAAKKDDPHGFAMLKAIRFIIQQQDQTTGRFGPGDGEGVNFMYNHGMATLAIAEAAGLSGDPYLREAAQKGIDYIVSTQTKAGGWNYKGKVEGNNDTSVSAWQVQALLAGRETGLKVPEETLTKALEMYRAATQHEGYVKYWLEKDDIADKGKIALCGTALMMRQLLGEDRRTADLHKLADTLRLNIPETHKAWGGAWRPNGGNNDDAARAKYDPYLIYFATYGMYFLGGKDWDTWHEGTTKGAIEGFKKAVLEMQATDGSWRCNDVNSYAGGTFYSTALSILALQVYYRIQ